MINNCRHYLDTLSNYLLCYPISTMLMGCNPINHIHNDHHLYLYQKGNLFENCDGKSVFVYFCNIHLLQYIYIFPQNNLLCFYWLIVGLTQGGTGVPCLPFTSSATCVPSTDPAFFCVFGVRFSPVQCVCWLVSGVGMGGVGWRGRGVCIDSWVLI